MRFELDPNNRGASECEMIEDMRAVAAKCGARRLGSAMYRRGGGRFHPSTIARRFGSWHTACDKAGLLPGRASHVDRDQAIADLKRCAAILGRDSLTCKQYDSDEDRMYSSTAIANEFGGWFAAMNAAGLKRSRTLGVSNEQYFDNLATIWQILGRQPKYGEVAKPLSRFSVGAYENRFGSWRGALEAFVEYMNAEHGANSTSHSAAPTDQTIMLEAAPPKRSGRSPSWRLRHLVMKRDGFRCCHCGSSPATSPGVSLHIDHIVPWAKGGDTTIDNLQTLCEKCNIGKSDSG